MKKRILTLLVAIACLVIVFAGCGGQEADVVGTWYEVNGVGGIIELTEDGVCKADLFGITLEGTYKYDVKAAKGTINMNVEDPDQESAFVYKDGKLIIEDIVYTKEVVEQKSLEDALNEVQDELNESMENIGEGMDDALEGLDESLNEAMEGLDDSLNEISDSLS